MHACAHTCMHIGVQCVVFLFCDCAIFVLAVILQLLQLRLLWPQKEAAHNYKFHSVEHKKKAAVDRPIENMPIYSELLGIFYHGQLALCL